MERRECLWHSSESPFRRRISKRYNPALISLSKILVATRFDSNDCERTGEEVDMGVGQEVSWTRSFRGRGIRILSYRMGAGGSDPGTPKFPGT